MRTHDTAIQALEHEAANRRRLSGDSATIARRHYRTAVDEAERFPSIAAIRAIWAREAAERTIRLLHEADDLDRSATTLRLSRAESFRPYR